MKTTILLLLVSFNLSAQNLIGYTKQQIKEKYVCQESKTKYGDTYLLIDETQSYFINNYDQCYKFIFCYEYSQLTIVIKTLNELYIKESDHWIEYLKEFNVKYIIDKQPEFFVVIATVM